MNNFQLGQYLTRGFVWDYNDYNIIPESTLSFEECKKTFYELLDINVKNIVSKNKKILWTMSSGLDTSAILSHAKKYDYDIHTVCIDNGRTDVEFSNKLAFDWGFKNHKILTIPNDFFSIENDLKFINSIFPTPYAHSYLYFSYFLFKYAEENNYDILVMGDGPDVSMLGTNDLHSDIILAAIKLKQYNYIEAEKISSLSSYLEKNAISLSKIRYNSLLKYVNTYPIYNDKFFYFIWEKKHLPNGILTIDFKLKENTLRHRMLAEWEQFIARTRTPTNLLLLNFNFKQISPYLETNICNFSLSIPAHYKYTLNSTKHLMREIYGKYLPHYILDKERTGFNPNNIWVEQYSSVIDELLYKYVKDESKKIHTYIDIGHLINIGEFTFNKKWALINLSIWMEQWL